MNKFERMRAEAQLTEARIAREANASREAVSMSQATHMLDLFRDLVAEHKTHNHEIRLVTGMGTAFVTIDGQVWSEFGRWPHRDAPVYATLLWIESQLDHEWDYHIPDGTLLNEPKEKP